MTPAQQLDDELRARLMPLTTLVSVKAPTASQMMKHCRSLTKVLDDHTGEYSAKVAVDLILSALFGKDEQPPSHWWSTPLGLLCARSLPDTLALLGIPQSEAAEILDVHRGTVTQLVARGTLPKSEDGAGVSFPHVLARLVRLQTAGNAP